jgi:FixJ family two-component response regulator
MIRGHIYLIDCDRYRRGTLASILQTHLYAVEVFDTAPAFLNQIDYQRLPPNACVLTYLTLKPLSGVELLDVFRADRVTLPTILMGATRELALAVKAMRYGASYVLWEPFKASLLIEVVANVLREWTDTASSTSADADRDALRSIEDRFSSLTPRQRQVVRYVFEGNGNREIAAALGISIKTVELHRACAMKKMRAQSVIALIRMMSDFHRALEDGT